MSPIEAIDAENLSKYLIVHGSHDALVHVDNAYRFKEKKLEILLIEKAGHNFNQLFEFEKGKLFKKLQFIIKKMNK